MAPLSQPPFEVLWSFHIQMVLRVQRRSHLEQLMRDHQLEPQVCLMMPLLEGLDGVQKMSKSLNNYVGVDESPNEIYGKLMSLPDSLLRRYYDLLSARPLSEVDALFAKMQSGEVNPKWVKSDLAVEIVTRYHSAQSAQAALQHFENVFSKKEIPEDIPETGRSTVRRLRSG